MLLTVDRHYIIFNSDNSGAKTHSYFVFIITDLSIVHASSSIYLIVVNPSTLFKYYNKPRTVHKVSVFLASSLNTAQLFAE